MAIQVSGSTVIHDSQDVQVSGMFTASSFVGDASQLTNLPASGGTLEATASGTLADGSKVVINTDGTVSVAAQTTTASSVGSPVLFNNGNTYYMGYKGAYDSTNGKVVIVYRDASASRGKAIVGTVSGTSIGFGTPVEFHSRASQDNIVEFIGNGKIVVAYQQGLGPYFGKARVGTISGTSISFGTEVDFHTGNSTQIGLAYDSANDKLVISYRDNANGGYGTARVGTVSGTNISFGSATVYEYSSCYNNSAIYDSANGKVVISYRDAGNSNYGTAVVGTVSGTSISFGSPVVFESASSYMVGSIYDSSNNKAVITYSDFGNSGYGTAVIGTVNTGSNTISFGTPVVFESASTNQISPTFDSNNGNVVIAYQDFGNSQYGTLIVGTVSGTSISFGSPTVFQSSSTAYTSAVYDPSNNKVVIAFCDYGDTDRGKASVFSPATTTTNLTAENYIGISNGVYSNGQTATIQVTGSVDDAQSGLTAGQAYYVQDDGTLGESGSVFAGTAVSASKIIVKG